MKRGILMFDIAGTQLCAEDRERLMHPLTGGVILFSRNYSDPTQLAELCAFIHGLRSPPLLIATDHEGGRVQRFRNGFTHIPAMRSLGVLWDISPERACQAASQVGFVLAAELRAHGVDISFAPVLDLDWGNSLVIGNRAIHNSTKAVIALAHEIINGMHVAGMSCCGKHFPGHGWTDLDSHIAMPEDQRTMEEIDQDCAPYRNLKLDSVMMAHVRYPKVDILPAGFSSYWISLLRSHSFAAVFSDDLTMEGAAGVGDMVARSQFSFDAGCDMLIICNAPAAVDQVLDHWRPEQHLTQDPRLESKNWSKIICARWRINKLFPTKNTIYKDVLTHHPLYMNKDANFEMLAELLENFNAKDQA